MEILYTTRFSREAKRVPAHVRAIVEARVLLFRTNPFDARLRTHKLSGALRGFWSFSIDYRYRIIFEFIEPEKVLFHSIGDHSIYD